MFCRFKKEFLLQDRKKAPNRFIHLNHKSGAKFFISLLTFIKYFKNNFYYLLLFLINVL